MNLNIPFSLTERLTLSPAVEFSGLIDRDIREKVGDNLHLVFTVTLSTTCRL